MAVNHDAEIDKLNEEITALKTKRAELMKTRVPETVTNYTFDGWSGPVTLKDLFGDKEYLWVIHNMGPGCTYCTLWADGLNGLTAPLNDASGFVLLNHETVENQQKFASSRGWKFKMVSGANSEFSKDMGFIQEDSLWPGASAFRKAADGSIQRVGRTYFGPGDDYCAIWPLLEVQGRSEDDWGPKINY